MRDGIRLGHTVPRRVPRPRPCLLDKKVNVHKGHKNESRSSGILFTPLSSVDFLFLHLGSGKCASSEL